MPASCEPSPSGDVASKLDAHQQTPRSWTKNDPLTPEQPLSPPSPSASLCSTCFDSAGWTTSGSEIMCHSVKLGHAPKPQHFLCPVFGALSLLPSPLRSAFRQFGPAPAKCDCGVNEALPFYLCSTALTMFFGVTAQNGPRLKCLNCDDLSECIFFPLWLSLFLFSQGDFCCCCSHRHFVFVFPNSPLYFIFFFIFCIFAFLQ